MTVFDRKSLKEIPVGASIHIIGKDLDVKGKVTRNDELGIGICSTRNTIIGLPISNLIMRYSFELL